MSKENNELDLIVNEYRDIQGNEFTQVIASCKCGRGGWIRLPKHPALYAPKPVENGELDLYRALQTLKDQDDNYVLSTISFSSQYGLQRLIEFIEARLAQEKSKWGQIVLEDVIGPDYFFTDDAMPTEAEKVTQASLNRLLERQRQALAKLLDKVKYHE